MGLAPDPLISVFWMIRAPQGDQIYEQPLLADRSPNGARLKPFFPKSPGKPCVDDRRALIGIIIINRNGLRWCDEPREYARPRPFSAAVSDGLAQTQAGAVHETAIHASCGITRRPSVGCADFADFPKNGRLRLGS